MRGHGSRRTRMVPRLIDSGGVLAWRVWKQGSARLCTIPVSTLQKWRSAHVIVYTALHKRKGLAMSITVGVREFRQGLTEYIDQTEPVTVTRHGQTVGLFIPVHRDRKADIAAYTEAAKKANALITEWGTTEDEVAVEFEELRRGEHETKRRA